MPLNMIEKRQQVAKAAQDAAEHHIKLVLAAKKASTIR